MSELRWEPNYKMNRQAAFLLGLSLVPMYVGFDFLGNAPRGIAVGCSAGMIVFAIKIYWFLRQYWWFWAAIVISLILQSPLILLPPPVSSRFTLMTVFPLMLIDYAIIYVLVRLSFNFATRQVRSSSSTQD